MKCKPACLTCLDVGLSSSAAIGLSNLKSGIRSLQQRSDNA